MCLKCKGAYHVLVDGRWQECECLVQTKKRRALVMAGIPKYMLNFKWSDWQKQYPGPAVLLPTVEAWAKKAATEGVKRALGLCGKGRTGKLTLAYLVVRRCVMAGMAAKIVTVSELIQDRFDTNGDLMREAMAVDLLCVRLGVEEEHKWRIPILEKIHFGRRVDEMATLYTIRHHAGTFEAAYGKVLADSFWQAGRDVVMLDLELGQRIGT
jgi:hypothetical protein